MVRDRQTSTSLALALPKGQEPSKGNNYLPTGLATGVERSPAMAAQQPQARPNDAISVFTGMNNLDHAAGNALRALPLYVQDMVMGEGPVRGRNPSAILMAWIRKYQSMPPPPAGSVPSLAPGMPGMAGMLTMAAAGPGVLMMGGRQGVR